MGFCIETLLGFSPKDEFQSHFLLPSEVGVMLSCRGCTCQPLPRGILSTSQAQPDWGTINRSHAGIFGGHYLASTHNGVVVKFSPEREHTRRRVELVGVSEGPYFGANPLMIFDASNEYWGLN
jgi:hypothetical protein